jgi:hypothetical protein
MKIIKISQEGDKFSSSDCVMAIVGDPRFSTTNPKDWKRRSKTKNEQGVWVRTFENKTTGKVVQVIENQNGVVIQESGKLPSKTNHQPQGAGNQQSPIYFYPLLITKDNYEEYGLGDEDMAGIGNYMLCVTTREKWKNEHCMIDEIPDWMIPILDEVGFPPEDMEAHYTIDQQLLDKIRADPRFYESPEFGNFMGGVGE